MESINIKELLSKVIDQGYIYIKGYGNTKVRYVVYDVLDEFKHSIEVIHWDKTKPSTVYVTGYGITWGLNKEDVTK